MKERNTGRKATTRTARAASTKAIREAVAREARRLGISPAELIRRSSDAHKRMSARGKLYRAPIMDFTPTTRKAIKALAAERGTTPEAVVARFEELYAGKPSKDGRGIFAPTK